MASPNGSFGAKHLLGNRALRQSAVAQKTMNDKGQKSDQDLKSEDIEVLEPSGKERRSRKSNRPEVSINMDELRELIDLIRANGLAEFELEHKSFRVRLRREEAPRSSAGDSELASGRGQERSANADSAQATPRQNPSSSPVHPGALAESAAQEDQDLHIITSPIVGTFYRSPSPTADVFVKIGSRVEVETVVCIIEAMKLMNEIQSETSGEVVKIYVENGQPVEYGQPLFGIKR